MSFKLLLNPRCKLIIFFIDDHSPIEYNQLTNVEVDILIEELEDCENRLEICNDSKSLAKTEDEKNSFDKDINLIKEEITQTKKDKKETDGLNSLIN